METIKKEELKTMYDKSKSFYKKAYIEYIINWSETHSQIEKIKLYSYNTLVCTIEYINNHVRFYNLHDVELYSQTTLRHIREFLQQLFYCNEMNLTKKEVLKNINKNYNITTNKFI